MPLMTKILESLGLGVVGITRRKFFTFVKSVVNFDLTTRIPKEPDFCKRSDLRGFDDS